MGEIATLIESLVESVEVYTNSSIDLLKLRAIDKSARVLSSVVSTLILSVVVLCIISMVNIGCALWIGELLHNSFSGFFIVAAFYCVLAIILYVFRQQLLKTPLVNSIITHIRKEKNI